MKKMFSCMKFQNIEFNRLNKVFLYLFLFNARSSTYPNTIYRNYFVGFPLRFLSSINCKAIVSAQNFEYFFSSSNDSFGLILPFLIWIIIRKQFFKISRKNSLKKCLRIIVEKNKTRKFSTVESSLHFICIYLDI